MKLRVFENTVLGRIFGPRRDEYLNIAPRSRTHGALLPLHHVNMA